MSVRRRKNGDQQQITLRVGEKVGEGFKYINYWSRIQHNLDLALSITWHSYHSNIWGLTICGSLYIQRCKLSWNTYYDQFEVLELLLSVKVEGCTSGMERITSSNSAGATWNPLTWPFSIVTHVNTERKQVAKDHQGHLDQFFEAVNDEKVATIVIITDVPGV